MAFGDGGGRAANQGGMGGSSSGGGSRGGGGGGRSSNPGRPGGESGERSLGGSPSRGGGGGSTNPGRPGGESGERSLTRETGGGGGGSTTDRVYAPGTHPGRPGGEANERGGWYSSDAANFVSGIPAVDTVAPDRRIEANTRAEAIKSDVLEGRVGPLPAIAAMVRNGFNAAEISNRLSGLEEEMGLPDDFFAGSTADYAAALNSQSLASVTGNLLGDEYALERAMRSDYVGASQNNNGGGGARTGGGGDGGRTPQTFSELIENVANDAEQGTATGNIARFQDATGVTATSAEARNMLDNPSEFMQGRSLAENTPQLTAADGTVINREADRFQVDANALNYNPATTNPAAIATQTAPGQVQGYTAATATDRITDIGQAQAATGEVSDQAVIDAPQTDLQGAATGINEDGSRNVLGEALNTAATQGIANVIDTSTVSGKLLAQELGEGNYTDAKATVQGQMEILSEQFTDPDGNPKIPTWAAGTAREVSRIAAFKGMTGTAATAAMSQALMEASLPIAQQDAQFFQTLTQQNLDNRQQMTINKANVLSRMELANLDSRMNAAVNNAKSFLQMDLANLDNEQQTEIVNTQARVQSILEDAKAENSARLFSADAQNDFTKFYDQLNTQIEQFNATQKNEMEMFNTGERNDATEFSATIENQREQFYKEMQYNIDIANAKWRQTIETTNAELDFRAAATDVQNLFDLSQESLNRIWDRADAALDYAWKSSENEANRNAQIAAAEIRAQAGGDDDSGMWSAVGSIGGAIAGSIFSDRRLKNNVSAIGVLANGITLYDWEWNSEAKKLGADQYPEFGVIAQEVLEVIPDAVSVHSSGYLTVDYSKVI